MSTYYTDEAGFSSVCALEDFTGLQFRPLSDKEYSYSTVDLNIFPSPAEQEATATQAQQLR
jgi:hypothetical protein